MDKAEHWFAKITAVGRLKPDVISYSALIQANAVAARPERALELLHEMTHKVLSLSLSLFWYVLFERERERGSPSMCRVTVMLFMPTSVVVWWRGRVCDQMW